MAISAKRISKTGILSLVQRDLNIFLGFLKKGMLKKQMPKANDR